MLCEITPVGKPGEPVDPGFGHPKPPSGGGKPELPIQLPPVPPGWEDGKPPVLPPSVGGGPIIPEWPVVIPKPPHKPGQPLPQPPGGPPTVGGGPVTPPGGPPSVGGGPITPPPTVGGGPIMPELPPGTVWPPLNPDSGLGGTGKYLVLIHVFGVGTRWLVYDATKPVEPTPPGPQPK